MAGGRRIYPIAAFFQFVPFVDEKSHIATVVDHQLWTLTIRMRNRSVCTPPIFFQGLTFPREYGNTRFGDRGSRMVLRRKDVATRPADGRTKIHQRLDQDGGLNRHVQRAGDPDACQWLSLCIFRADRHQARHFLFGNFDLFSPKLSQAEIGNLMVDSSFGSYVAHVF